MEHAGPSFANWSPVNPETTLLFKEAAWEKYKYRSAAEIAQMCDDQIDAATVTLSCEMIGATRRNVTVSLHRPSQ